jgi:hypothetical protein
MKNIFAEKLSQKVGVFFIRNKAKLRKILIIKLAFEKNTNFFVRKLSKIAKIAIITSTPGHPVIFFLPPGGAHKFEEDIHAEVSMRLNKFDEVGPIH